VDFAEATNIPATNAPSAEERPNNAVNAENPKHIAKATNTELHDL